MELFKACLFLALTGLCASSPSQGLLKTFKVNQGAFETMDLQFAKTSQIAEENVLDLDADENLSHLLKLLQEAIQDSKFGQNVQQIEVVNEVEIIKDDIENAEIELEFEDENTTTEEPATTSMFSFPTVHNTTTMAPNTTHFTFPPMQHNTTVTPPKNTTKFTFPPMHNTTVTPPKNTTKFTFPPMHNTTTAFTFPPLHTTTGFTFPPIHTTKKNPLKDDLVPIIVGAALGGLVIVVLAGYFIVRWKNRRAEADDQERLVH
jgi:hypothetical protein